MHNAARSSLNDRNRARRAAIKGEQQDNCQRNRAILPPKIEENRTIFTGKTQYNANAHIGMK
jgi:hypothetical protein